MTSYRDAQREDVAPPGYDEVISSTRYPVLRSGTRSQSDGEVFEDGDGNGPSWSLRFADFTPHFPRDTTSRKTKYQFNLLMERANTWLQSNKDVNIRSCETVTWSASDFSKLNDTDVVKSTLKRSKFSKVHHMRGLRLWVTPRQTEGDGVTLGMRDFVPDLCSSAAWNKNISSYMRIVDEWVAQDENIGRVLTVETVAFPASDVKNLSNVTYWTESPDSDRQYVICVRVFYTAGRKNRDISIGLTDFVPRKYKVDGHFRYEDLELLVGRASEWAVHQPHVTVLNLHTLLLRKRDVQHHGTEALSYWVYGTEDAGFLMCLRLVYLKPRTVQSLRVIRPSHHALQKKTFAPQRSVLTREENALPDELKYVTFTRTVDQVSDWLDKTGADLLCAETFYAPMKDGNYSPQPDCTLVMKVGTKTEESVAHIRIYLRTEANMDVQPQVHLNRKYYPFSQRAWRKFNSQRHHGPHYFRSRRRCCLAVAIILTLLGVGILAGVLVAHSWGWFDSLKEM